MRIVYLISLLFSITVVSCNTKTTNKTAVKEVENKIQDSYPFVEFDSMFLISIDSKDSKDSKDLKISFTKTLRKRN